MGGGLERYEAEAPGDALGLGSGSDRARIAGTGSGAGTGGREFVRARTNSCAHRARTNGTHRARIGRRARAGGIRP